MAATTGLICPWGHCTQLSTHMARVYFRISEARGRYPVTNVHTRNQQCTVNQTRPHSESSLTLYHNSCEIRLGAGEPRMSVRPRPAVHDSAKQRRGEKVSPCLLSAVIGMPWSVACLSSLDPTTTTTHDSPHHRIRRLCETHTHTHSKFSRDVPRDGVEAAWTQTGRWCSSPKFPRPHARMCSRRLEMSVSSGGEYRGEDSAKHLRRAPGVLRNGSVDEVDLAMGGCLDLGCSAHDMSVRWTTGPRVLSCSWLAPWRVVREHARLGASHEPRSNDVNLGDEVRSLPGYLGGGFLPQTSWLTEPAVRRGPVPRHSAPSGVRACACTDARARRVVFSRDPRREW